jgi:hypothetical protein
MSAYEINQKKQKAGERANVHPAKVVNTNSLR